MIAVILVGGEGTRLRPLTLDAPKPLMPVGGRPFLSHLLANLARHGVEEAILTTGYMAEAFEGFGPAERHGVRLTVVREDTPLGTCGAVRNVAGRLDETFLVFNGDILTDLDLTALVSFHRERGAAGTLALTRVQDPTAYGLVPVDGDGRIERFLEKPRHDEIVTNLINAGTYVLEPRVLDGVPEGENHSFERGLFPDLLHAGEPMFGFTSSSYWLDVGKPATYLQANVDVLERKAGHAPPGHEGPAGVWVDQGAEIDGDAVVRGPVSVGRGSRVAATAAVYPMSCIGAGSSIGPRATIEQSVLHDDVEVGEEAVVERSILGRGTVVGRRTRISDAVIGPGVRIGEDNELRAGIRLWPGLHVPDATIRF